jgi:hypothetical protein
MRNLFLAVLLLTACDPELEGTPVTPSSAAPDVPREPEMRVLSEEEAAAQGLAARDVAVTFTESSNLTGADMLSAWFARAKESGARVGSIAMYVVAPRESDTVECRTAIVPERSVETRFVPPSERLTNVMHPVQRAAMHMESHCQMVSHPETHTQTTYTMQYDFASKSSHSVPHTQTVTTQVMRNECHMVPVTTMETHWEWTTERVFVPPTREYLTQKQIREGER